MRDRIELEFLVADDVAPSAGTQMPWHASAANIVAAGVIRALIDLANSLEIHPQNPTVSPTQSETPVSTHRHLSQPSGFRPVKAHFDSIGSVAMLLIGMFDSPFLRRVAVSSKLLGFEFEHANWSVGKDHAQIRRYSPLGRVPTVVLENGEVLTESAAILDYLDAVVGPERALVPTSGAAGDRCCKSWLSPPGRLRRGSI